MQRARVDMSDTTTAAMKQTGSWYSEMTADQRRTFWASFWGLATDGMDILLYSFMIPTLIALWQLSRADAGLLGEGLLDAIDGGLRKFRRGDEFNIYMTGHLFENIFERFDKSAEEHEAVAPRNGQQHIERQRMNAALEKKPKAV